MSLDSADRAEIVQMIQLGVSEALRNTARGSGASALPVPVTRSATVVTATPPDLSTVLVKCDGDLTPIPATNAVGRYLTAGARVVVTFVPPHGIFVTGVMSSAWSDDVRLAGGRLATSASELLVQGIPGDFHYLRFVISCRNNQAGNVATLLQFNGNTSSVYDIEVVAVDQSNAVTGLFAVTQGSISLGNSGGASTVTRFWSNGDLRIFDYADAGKNASVLWDWFAITTGDVRVTRGAGIYDTATVDPVRSMRVYPATGQFVGGTEWALYGCGRRPA